MLYRIVNNLNQLWTLRATLLVNSDKSVMEVTSCFLVGLEVHYTEGNPHLVM